METLGENENNEEEEEICPICLIDLNTTNDNGTHTLKCNHTFHADCIFNWITSNNNNNNCCPICRTDATNMRCSEYYPKVKLLRKLSLRKKSPPLLRSIGATVRENEKEYKAAQKELNGYKKTNKNIFKELDKLRKQVCTKKYKYFKSRDELAVYPILPLMKDSKTFIRVLEQ
jgi:hypothetical protein